MSSAHNIKDLVHGVTCCHCMIDCPNCVSSVFVITTIAYGNLKLIMGMELAVVARLGAFGTISNSTC
jgi:molybdopterin-binding protein